MFYMKPVSYNPLTATFQLSSETALNLGWSQNGVLGNGLKIQISALRTIPFVIVHLHNIFFSLSANTAAHNKMP